MFTSGRIPHPVRQDNADERLTPWPTSLAWPQMTGCAPLTPNSPASRAPQGLQQLSVTLTKPLPCPRRPIQTLKHAVRAQEISTPTRQARQHGGAHCQLRRCVTPWLLR